MGTPSSTNEATEDSSSDESRALSLPLPVREADLFKHEATPHILNFLSDNPEINLSLRQLTQVTPVSERATREAVNVLVANGLVESFHEGNARRVHINRNRLTDTTDPLLAVPQPQFQVPVRVARRYIEEELDDVKGIILFGSVAQGNADRRSDIDLWVLVAEDHLEQRHRANKLAKHLGELKIPRTVSVPDVEAADFETDWAEIKDILENKDSPAGTAERYSFQILVETPQSIIGQADRVEAEKLFGYGITLLSTELLDRVKMEVFNNE
ncbi:Nucleotidyltransferase domain-containing protein [Halovenus aranensis]|uniref:Nucleotidyltransferase domain-containing protein n=1 Tax=Halovenus aranensis TaxID=890420 RepID=A0A1G8UMT3_9EURY|nr:nucleotidyltransferase domain-containing protein [Halovenus aranensis]SDJ55029.1 Nucleotidyltransferase domain-containing protein [Halovenus aranensis]